jgi:hypothetical protein
MGSLPLVQTITARRLARGGSLTIQVQEAVSDVLKVSNQELSTFTSQDQRTESCRTLHCPVMDSPFLAILQAD